MVFAVLVLLGLGSAALAVPEAPSADAGGTVLAYRVGDRLTYQDGRGAWTYEVLAPRLVRGADFSTVEALPFAFAREGSAPTGNTLVPLLDPATGALAVMASFCLLDASVPCEAAALVTWQACAFNGVLGGPLNTLTREQLAAATLTARDPDGGTSWTYDVKWESGSLVRLILASASEARTRCFVPAEAVLDVEARVIVELTLNGDTKRLVARTLGPGIPIPIGGAPMPRAEFVPAQHARDAPYPPGAGARGPAEWTLEAAWTQARADSRDLQAFLGRNPRAFMTAAGNGTSWSSAAFGLVETTMRDWTFTLTSLSGDSIEVTSAKRILPGGVPLYATTVAPTRGPEEAPPSFAPPAAFAADFAAFVARAAEAGLSAGDSPLQPDFIVDFDGERAVYEYVIPLNAETTDTGGLVATQTTSAFIMRETGRLLQLWADEPTARRTLFPEP